MCQESFTKELALEWTNLRTEIFELDKACLNILQFAIALTSALFVVWTKNEGGNIKPQFIYFLLSTIWTFLYMYLYHKRLRIVTIDGYLKKFIENNEGQRRGISPLWITRLSEYRGETRISHKEGDR